MILGLIRKIMLTNVMTTPSHVTEPEQAQSGARSGGGPYREGSGLGSLAGGSGSKWLRSVLGAKPALGLGK